jgi:hypothetical protein
MRLGPEEKGRVSFSELIWRRSLVGHRGIISSSVVSSPETPRLK